jgi:C4-dicarboxylate-specific signal transduction histidine kinase
MSRSTLTQGVPKTTIADRAPSPGTIAAAVAHAVRNPLASAIAQLERLTLALGPAAAEGETCERIAESLDRIRGSIEDLTEFASPPVAHPRPLRLAAWLREQGPVFEIFTETRGAQLVVRPPTQEALVVADPKILRRAILRLLANAVDAGDSQLKLEVTLDRANAILTVVDRAPMDGGPRAIPVRPFHTTKARGLGLGLSLVKASIAGFGAQLSVGRASSGETRASLRLRRTAEQEVAP